MRTGPGKDQKQNSSNNKNQTKLKRDLVGEICPLNLLLSSKMKVKTSLPEHLKGPLLPSELGQVGARLAVG